MTYSIRQLLNAARWRDQLLHAVRLVVRHRGAPGDVREVAGSAITAIHGRGVEISDAGASQFLPYHRFLRVEGPAGPLWTKEDGLVEAAAPSWRPLPTDVEVRCDDSSADGLILDGRAGEGGGQLLRSSLTLSLLTGRPFTLRHIRAGRSKPGLRRQHLTCVHAAAAISGAQLRGAKLGSDTLSFRPGPVRAGTYRFDIGSAGATTLVLQTLLLPLATAEEPSSITLLGGTHAQWAPPYPAIAESWLPLLELMGVDASLRLVKAGFYPRGGGELSLTVRPSRLRPLPQTSGHTVDAPSLRAYATLSGLPDAIGQRELETLTATVTDGPLSRRIERLESPGMGNLCWLAARRGPLTNVFSVAGRRGLPAEEVGQQVAALYAAWRKSGCDVEEYLADQLQLPVAIAGGSYTTHVLSRHARTNRAVIEAFTEESMTVLTDGNSFRIEGAVSSSQRG